MNQELKTLIDELAELFSRRRVLTGEELAEAGFVAPEILLKRGLLCRADIGYAPAGALKKRCRHERPSRRYGGHHNWEGRLSSKPGLSPFTPTY